MIQKVKKEKKERKKKKYYNFISRKQFEQIDFFKYKGKISISSDLYGTSLKKNVINQQFTFVEP